MRLAFLSLCVFALFLGCAAHTKVYDRKTGLLVLDTRADAQTIAVAADGGFAATGLNHSNPTLAAGTADARRINATSGAIMATAVRSLVP